jgi:hypothetical protein
MGEEKTLSGKNFFWYVASILLILIVVYALYNGMVPKKMNIPGVMEIEFTRGGLESGQKTAEMDSSELVQRQQNLMEKQRQVDLPSMESADKALDEFEMPAEVAGSWISSQGVTYAISQSGMYISLQEYYPGYGMTASGSGKFDGTTLTVNYETILGTLGRLALSISEDGNRLSGEYTDQSSGSSGTLELTRVMETY